MEVTIERFEDADDLHMDGKRDWYYAGTIYLYREQGRIYKARRYDDTPTEASIFFFQFKDITEGVPYNDPLFLQVVRHLVNEVGIAKIRILTATEENGYAEVDISRALSPKVLSQ